MTGTHYQPILLWPLTLLHCWMFTGMTVDLVFCNAWYYKLCFLLEPLIIIIISDILAIMCTHLILTLGHAVASPLFVAGILVSWMHPFSTAINGILYLHGLPVTWLFFYYTQRNEIFYGHIRLFITL